MVGAIEVARRWRLVEVSLVPAGKDPAALTRSLPSIPSSDPMETNTAQAAEALDNANDEQEPPALRQTASFRSSAAPTWPSSANKKPIRSSARRLANP